MSSPRLKEDDLDDDLYGDLDAAELEEELLPPANEVEDALTEQPAKHDYTPQPVAGPSGGQQAPAFNANEASRAAANGGPGQPSNDSHAVMRTSDTPDAGKMFIGGLNWETTDDGLREYFAQFGKVESSMIMRDPSGRSRGFAFLTFSDPAAVNVVVSREHFLDNKNIDPKRAIPRAEHERSAKVFVGGLAPSVTQETLKTFFTQFGAVLDATVMYDRESTRSKGFGFVNFADESTVDKILLVPGLAIDNKQVEVKRAQPRGAGPPPVNGRFGGGGAQRSFGQQAPFMGGMNAMGGMGGMAGGGAFDPQAMAQMYQKMMMGGGMGMGMGMGNAPAVNPAMMNGQGMGGMMGMGGMGMGMMNPMMAGMMPGQQMNGMQGMGMQGMGNFAGNQQFQGRPPTGPSGAPANAPRGPAAMRGGVASPNGAGSSSSATGAGPARYSTQGNARAKPY